MVDEPSRDRDAEWQLRESRSKFRPREPLRVLQLAVIETDPGFRGCREETEHQGRWKRPGLGAVIAYLVYLYVGLLVDFAAYRVLEAFTGFGKAGDSRVPALRPARLPTEKAAIAVRHEHDDCRIDPREYLSPAFRIDADSRVSTRLRSSR